MSINHEPIVSHIQNASDENDMHFTYILLNCYSQWVDSGGLPAFQAKGGNSFGSSLLIFPWSDSGSSHSMFADSLQPTN